MLEAKLKFLIGYIHVGTSDDKMKISISESYRDENDNLNLNDIVAKFNFP